MGKFKKAITFLISSMMAFSMIGCTGGTTTTGDGTKTENTASTSTEAKQEAETTSDEVVTLNLWHIWAAESESSKAPFEAAVKEFNEENPNIQVVLDATENETYKTKMTATIAANEAPDIYFYWSGGYMKNIVDAGKVLALDEYLDDATKDKILNGTLTNMTFDGKIYGIGHSMSVGTFFVNTELFNKYSVKIPETWDELVTACKTFKDNGITPMAVGAKDRWCIDMYLDIIETRAAGYETCYNALTKKGSFVDEGIIEGAAKLQELVDMGAFTNGALGVSRDESEVPFYNGQIPMYVNGSWTIGNINADDCPVKGKISIAKFPTINEKSNVNDFTGGVAETFVVNAATKHPKEAVYALRTISEKFSKNLYLSGAGIPTWKVDVDESQIDPLTLQLVDLIQDSNSFTLWWNTLLEGEDSETYMNKSAELFAKQITPEEFVKQLQTMNE
ncbi:extracellular solute-binding protein [Cellulosilyticum sp. ST5]|uniref:extracellular solute-binding protein n=1 Tax=unclassified Cellulosilyticum TaxID=2643091 RepID=UPI000F8E8EF2|nr:extracellular solute-binding protein [Cellulosilyticum sp. WCF-2]QEH67994.1 extracellular solute-binding protein [Cellulosilyticum sp. WCF-2]